MASVNRVDCVVLDYSIEVYRSPTYPDTECYDVRMAGVNGWSDVFTLVDLALIHIVLDADAPDCFPVDLLCVEIQRLVDCNTCDAGCDEYELFIPVVWKGPGMMLAPGKYKIQIPDQFIPADHKPGDEYNIRLVIEPVPRSAVDAALYNETIQCEAWTL